MKWNPVHRNKMRENKEWDKERDFSFLVRQNLDLVVSGRRVDPPDVPVGPAIDDIDPP